MSSKTEKYVKERPSKETVYLTMAFVIAQRSFDNSSKCGCIIVSEDDRILSAGLNGPIKGVNDNMVPLTRPETYAPMLHGEENALIAYSGSKQDIHRATAYVTGKPCHRCFRMLAQKGIKKIVHGRNATKVLDQDDYDAQKLMLEYGVSVEFRSLESNDDIIGLLNRTIKYIQNKDKQMDNYQEK